MGRPVTKAYLGKITTEVKLGELREPLAREAAADGIYITDLVRRELARFLMYRGHRVDRRLLDPTPIHRRLAATVEEAPALRGG